VLDLILEAGADYRMGEVEIGRTNLDPSRAVIEITHDDVDLLEHLLEQLQVHGANRGTDRDADVVAADQAGVLPAGFYSTTNLATDVRVDGQWVAVENPEMDCGLVVRGEGDGVVVRTVPMHGIAVGDRVVVGHEGVRVHAPERPRDARSFEFMTSDVSSEKPKALLLSEVTQRIRLTKARGGRVLAVCGPAVVHTGAAPDVARLVREGWIDVLFSGNGFAAHDMESNVLGTSLGISVVEGTPIEHGHSNHLRVINEVRRHGSIAKAVESGFITGGVMYECVRHDVPFVLGGSIRDDGPLPDTIADVVAAADAMRGHIAGVAVALMLASTLHAIATGNILPAGVETFCVDINQAVVTKLADRGSHQALGIVTDVGPFVRQLADHLVGNS
jgi:lysine-ketoglutarate reductase/saccharopine dehydrogenase-like protein (TIGR00300 family)